MSRGIIVLALLCTAVCSLPVSAEYRSPIYKNGDDLLTTCTFVAPGKRNDAAKLSEAAAQGECYGYLQAVAEGAAQDHGTALCLPEQVSNELLTGVWVAWAQVQHSRSSGRLIHPAYGLVLEAFGNAWPCTG